MTEIAELRKLEQWLTYVRWFGVVFAVVSILTQTNPAFPDRATEMWAWTLAAALLIGSLAIWGTLIRLHTEKGLGRLGAAAFAFDAAIVMGTVWVYTFETPYVTWALLFVLPLEGALRWCSRGAFVAGAAVAIFFLPQTIHFAQVHDRPLTFNLYIFGVGLSAIIAAVAGTMAENWRAKSRAFEQQSARLAELDRLKDRYLAVTTHEIRGPLTAIVAAIDMIDKRGERMGEQKRTEMVRMVGQQAQQLARLVDDLMLSSELQAGSLALDAEWVEVEPVIQQALDAAASKRQQHRLELFLEPVQAEIDPVRVTQIVRNLVENAYKYTPDTTRVAVSSRATSTGIWIEVADDGPGIPPEQRDKLFAAFSRIEETAAGREGVGLGLFVVSQLVTAMRGRIDFSSSERGTSFGIHIPCPTQTADRRRLGLVQGGPARA